VIFENKSFRPKVRVKQAEYLSFHFKTSGSADSFQSFRSTGAGKYSGSFISKATNWLVKWANSMGVVRTGCVLHWMSWERRCLNKAGEAWAISKTKHGGIDYWLRESTGSVLYVQLEKERKLDREGKENTMLTWLRESMGSVLCWARKSDED
jgi:hypothetical protein